MSRFSSWFRRACLAAGLAMPAAAVLAGGFRPDIPADTTLRPLSFAALSGWDHDDLSKAVAPFRDTCRAILVPPADPALRPVVPTPPALAGICRRALETPLDTDAAARRFFETEFRPYEVLPPVGHGFLTGYFEPEVEGSLTRTAEFTAPLLARPADLVTLWRGQTFAGLPVKLTAAPIDLERVLGEVLPQRPLHLLDRCEARSGGSLVVLPGVLQLHQPGGGLLIHCLPKHVV